MLVEVELSERERLRAAPARLLARARVLAFVDFACRPTTSMIAEAATAGVETVADAHSVVAWFVDVERTAASLVVIVAIVVVAVVTVAVDVGERKDEEIVIVVKIRFRRAAATSVAQGRRHFYTRDHVERVCIY